MGSPNAIAGQSSRAIGRRKISQQPVRFLQAALFPTEVLGKCAVEGLFSSAPRYILREIRIQHVLRDHPLGVKERPVERDGGTHHYSISFGLSIKHRQDNVFEFVVKRGNFLVLAVRILVLADGPTGDSFVVAFEPPTVAYA